MSDVEDERISGNEEENAENEENEENEKPVRISLHCSIPFCIPDLLLFLLILCLFLVPSFFI